MICLSPGRSFDAAALAELPHNPAVIFGDDAHRDPAAIAPLLPYVRVTNSTQLMLASRPSGTERLRGEIAIARCAPSQVERGCCVGGEQDQAGLADASSFSSSVSTGVQFRGVSLPSGCDHDRSSLVYLRYGLSYRDVEELLVERGITVDHVTIYRWVQRFTPLLIDAARPCRHAPGDRWFVDETYIKVAERWVYLYRAIDQFGQVIDVFVSEKRDLAATRRFFTRTLKHSPHPVEVSTDRAPAYPRVLDELLPSSCHVTEQYANNTVEADHGRLKARLRPMRGLKRLCSARVICTGHAFVQNLRRGHYELALDLDPNHRIPAAFTEHALAI